MSFVTNEPHMQSAAAGDLQVIGSAVIAKGQERTPWK
jgi:hypothetical protein